MWWGMAAALVLTVPLVAFYVFGWLHLVKAARDAPLTARRVLLSASRASLANAVHMAGIVVILLFVGARGERPGGHVWWMALLVVLPPLYMVFEGRRRARARKDLDGEAARFLESLDRVPALPWRKRV